MDLQFVERVNMGVREINSYNISEDARIEKHSDFLCQASDFYQKNYSDDYQELVSKLSDICDDVQQLDHQTSEQEKNEQISIILAKVLGIDITNLDLGKFVSILEQFVVLVTKLQEQSLAIEELLVIINNIVKKQKELKKILLKQKKQKELEAKEKDLNKGQNNQKKPQQEEEKKQDVEKPTFVDYLLDPAHAAKMADIFEALGSIRHSLEESFARDNSKNNNQAGKASAKTQNKTSVKSKKTSKTS